MGRKAARVASMKLLYQMEVNKDFSNKVIDIFFENNKYTNDEKEYILSTISSVIKNIKEIDDTIEKYSDRWKINRIAKVDLNILRIAISEIKYRGDIPIQVSINEALEISKKYSTEESSKFINGVLGSYVRAEKDTNA